MAWAEWEQLKADAADRSSAQMQLNKVAPEEGGGSLTTNPQGDLKVNQADLAAVGNEAFKLYQRLWDEARVAVPTSDTAASDLTTQGFELGGALQHVSNRWDKQLKSLMDSCAHISNHMDFTKNAHQGDEYFIKRNVSSIATLDQGFDDDYAAPGKPNKADN